MSTAALPPISRLYIVTQLFTLAGLILILQTGLLPTLLGGLLVFLLVESGAKALERLGIIPRRGRLILLAFISAILAILITAGVLSLTSFISNGQDSYVKMLSLMADTVDRARTWLPANVIALLPENIGEWQKAASDWLREHAGQFGNVGKVAGAFLVHLLFGVILGGMVAIAHRKHPRERKALARALIDRLDHLSHAFRNVVFSQIRISLLNTVLTGAFLVVVMPAMGHPLPFTKTLIAVTFFAGLLPIIGNLISNTVITLVALSVALQAALGALLYLVVIHKLEYFFNAHIIGNRIKAQAWEVLLAMVVMEAVFGMPGLVAAPIFYAYIKEELVAQKLV